MYIYIYILFVSHSTLSLLPPPSPHPTPVSDEPRIHLQEEWCTKFGIEHVSQYTVVHSQSNFFENFI